MNPARLRLLMRRYPVVGPLAVGFLILFRVSRRFRLALAAFALPLASLLIFRPSVTSLSGQGVVRPASHLLRVTFLDVGKGDAAVIESPTGKVWIVDTGNKLRGTRRDMGRRVVLPFLRARGIRRVDTLLITHPHNDHAGGAASIVENIAVGQVADNGVENPKATYRSYREAAEKKRVPCMVFKRGQTFDLGGGVTVKVLAPAHTQAKGYINNTSLVLRVEYGRTAFLLTGDAEIESEDEMRRTGQPLRSDVLKVGHHGGRQSTSEKFLKAVKPSFAIISVDAHNRNGHPSKEVLSRLEKQGADIFRTDQDGAIACTTDGREMQIVTRPRK